MPGGPDLTVKLGESLTLNGYPMMMLAVGNLKVAGAERVEIVILQKLEEEPEVNPHQESLREVLKTCGFLAGTQKDIIGVAIGRMDFRGVVDLSDAECDTAEAAIISAVLDREQLEREKDG